MRESTARHIIQTADALRQSSAGTTCKIKWTSSSSGSWDSVRGEYSSGTAIKQTEYDVPCLIKQLGPAQIKWGNYGNAQSGDLIVAIDSLFDLEGKIDLIIIIEQVEYKVVPNSDIPFETLSGIIGDERCSKVLHCRYDGSQVGVV
jgi:hypothetical protein